MAIDPAILGGAVILGGIHHPQPTCTIQMPDGESSKGLECIVQSTYHPAAWEIFAIVGGSLLFVGLVFATILFFEKREDKKREKLGKDRYIKRVYK